MKKCPRCLRLTMQNDKYLNSLSRRDNKTYICNPCGDEESHIDLRNIQPTAAEKRFVALLKKKAGPNLP